MDGSYEKIISIARNAFNSEKTRPLSFRVAQLRQIIKMMEENRREIEKAANLDLRKHSMETNLYEIEAIIHESKVMIENIKKFTAPDKLPFNWLGALDSGTIEKVPYGVVLILGAWNYPFLLSLQPMVGAIASGNCVVLKPSEVAHNTSELIAKLVPKYLDTECYKVIQGNPEQTQHLLQYKFDYIFYTGSTNVGKYVMKAAAHYCTPLTLELGGKSPVYVDDNVNFETACKRILWGRTANCGQTCIAPDYLLCSKKVEAKFLEIAGKLITEWYGENPQASTSLTRIVNQKHCLRLKQLLDTTRGRIVFGGAVDVEDVYVAPTIVVDVNLDDPLMQEEIFGPILPIITVNSVEEAIDIINSRPRPLALYAFSSDAKVNQKLKDKTLSGTVCINDTLWQYVWNGLPFGGIGDSGFGNYHGKFSIETFTHKRSVLERSLSGISEKLGEARYAPYTASKLSMFTFIIRHFLKFDVRPMPWITHGLAFAFGIIAIICIQAAK